MLRFNENPFREALFSVESQSSDENSVSSPGEQRRYLLTRSSNLVMTRTRSALKVLDETDEGYLYISSVLN